MHDADRIAFDELSGRRGKIGTFASYLVLIEYGGAWSNPMFPSAAFSPVLVSRASVEHEVGTGPYGQWFWQLRR